MSNNSSSLPSLLRKLWREGFFATSKEASEISGGLAAQGHNFNSGMLATALLRAVRTSGFLTRVKQSGKWKYIQKHPITSAAGQRTDFFEKYDLHPQVKTVALKQFEDGNFKESIQNALVEVIDQVKVKAGYPKDANGRELDGDTLMNHVFGCDTQVPKIAFNSLRTTLDRAEQRGMMNLFKGIVGVRDRKAHLNFIQKDPLKTIEYLSLASLLMRLLDENPSAPKKKR